MATRGRKPSTTSTATKTQTKKKESEIEVVSTEVQPQDSKMAELENQNKILQKQLAELMKSMKEMQKPVKTTTIIDSALSDKKVKVISLLNNPVKIGIGSDSVRFSRYGEERRVKFGRLEWFVSHAKEMADRSRIPMSTFERGCVYIADEEIVEELGLTKYYEKILDKNKIDSIVNLEDDTAINLFMGASREIKETIVELIAENIKNGTNYDLNLISRLGDIYGKNILDVSKSLLDTSKSAE